MAGDYLSIGVVGPVRAGKSTFIKRFMETQIIPNIDNAHCRERAGDELPQSGNGRIGDDLRAEVRAGGRGHVALDEGRELLRAAHRLRGLHGPRRGGTA